jgi:hypothetical protein
VFERYLTSSDARISPSTNFVRTVQGIKDAYTFEFSPKTRASKKYLYYWSNQAVYRIHRCAGTDLQPGAPAGRDADCGVSADRTDPASSALKAHVCGVEWCWSLAGARGETRFECHPLHQRPHGCSQLLRDGLARAPSGCGVGSRPAPGLLPSSDLTHSASRACCSPKLQPLHGTLAAQMLLLAPVVLNKLETWLNTLSLALLPPLTRTTCNSAAGCLVSALAASG